MNDPGAPRRGRHSSPDEGWGSEPPSWGAGSSFWSDEAPEWDAEVRDGGPSTVEAPYQSAGHRSGASEWTPGGGRRSGLLERWPDETGPMPEWRHRGGGGPAGPNPGPSRDSVPPSSGGGPGPVGPDPAGGSRHPSGPLPPLPRSAWSKLQPRDPGVDDDHEHDEHHDYDDHDDHDETVAVEPIPADDVTEAHRLEGDGWDRTGGLEVIGAHVEEDAARRGLFRRPRRPGPRELYADEHHDELHDDEFRDDDLHEHDLHDDDLHDDEFRDDDLHDDEPLDLRDDDTVGSAAVFDGDIPIAPYDPRPQRRRKRRKRVALFVSLVVLAGLIGGVVFGGQKLWGLVHSQDYVGSGTGNVHIRVHQGDTLTDIGNTMVGAKVVASVRPFVKAAEANSQSTGIAPGLYGLRHHMSGKAALELLLKPSSRLVSRVTLPEGLTATQILQRLSQATGVPIAELQAAAANPASLGLPAYANGSLEGFLFPATYDFEPGTAPQQMLSSMVTRTVQVLDQLQIPADQRLSVLTEASIVQAESGSAEDMPKVARVLDNRLAMGKPLQLDTTVNYANGKSGLTTTAQDRANPSPYNTYVHTGLPPGPISNPGEDALKAVLAPAQGDWLFFVVVNPDTGETRFAVTDQEHAANVALFQQWLRDHPGG